MDYFQKHDHKLVPSSPVIPFDDPTILFINAGMNQFKDVFSGARKVDFKRATSSQKCIRAGGKHNDLDNVGFTARHHTFFEMLGNFSFGDYYKEEAIFFAWEWATKVVGLNKEKLYATVLETDDEAFALWEKIAPELKNGRVMRFGKHDNFWSMGPIGPCGPCSELHYDRGEKFGIGPEHVINGDTDRFVEIWNLVFMQDNQLPDGTVVPLPNPSVDTGAGLERWAAILQNADTNYGIDLFQGLIEAISDITGKKYSEHQSSHQVIADHIRALTFALADGGGISSEKRGYVLKRILRRAVYHGHLLGMNEPFIYRLVPVLVDAMGKAYPEIEQQQEHVSKVIKIEEESFLSTIQSGMEKLKSLIDRAVALDHSVIDGRQVFILYDTYGFPYDLTEIIAREHGLSLDKDGYDQAMKEQQERSRAGADFNVVLDSRMERIIKLMESRAIRERNTTEFFRDGMEVESEVIFHSGFSELRGTAVAFDFAIALETSPFYVEAGGQDFDKGTIQTGDWKMAVNWVRERHGFYEHYGKVISGDTEKAFSTSVVLVLASVDVERRESIQRNHTATHLLHQALSDELGDHVKQSGSYVGPDRLRFDFSHHQPMTSAEIRKVEESVNKQISLGIAVDTSPDASIEDAKKAGAKMQFGEKYGDKVRMVSIGKFSTELCGGTHVENTSQIEKFMITIETGIASGIRRIEAITGRLAHEQAANDQEFREDVCRILSVDSDKALDGVVKVRDNNALLEKLLKEAKAAQFSGEEADESQFVLESVIDMNQRVVAGNTNINPPGDISIDEMLSNKAFRAQVARIVNRLPSEALVGVEKLRDENIALQKELKKTKEAMFAGGSGSIGSEEQIGQLTLYTHDFGKTDRDSMGAWLDSLKEKNEPLAVVAVGQVNGKVTFMAAGSSAAVKTAGLHIGKLTKEVLSQFGGRGGGKPNFAQGSTADGTNSEDIFKATKQYLSKL